MHTLNRMSAIRNYWIPRDLKAQVLVRVTDIDWLLHEIARLKEVNINQPKQSSEAKENYEEKM